MNKHTAMTLTANNLEAVLASYPSLAAGRLTILTARRFRITREFEFEGKKATFVDTFIVRDDKQVTLIQQVNKDSRMTESDLYVDLNDALDVSEMTQHGLEYVFQYIDVWAAKDAKKAAEDAAIAAYDAQSFE